MIYQMLSASKDDIILLRAYVGDEMAWRAHLHPFIVDPLFDLRGIPTLILWENDSIAGRLEKNESHIPLKIYSLLT